MTEGVVEDQGGAVVLVDEEGAGEAGDEGELLLGADAEAVEGEGDASLRVTMSVDISLSGQREASAGS